MSVQYSIGTISADSRALPKGYDVLASGNANIISNENDVEYIRIELASTTYSSGSAYPVYEIINNLSIFNYMWVGAPLNRFYYIRDRRVKIGGVVEFAGECDVLMSFKAAILGLEALLLRTEGGADYTPDSAYPLYPYKEIKIAELEGGDFNIESADGLSYNYVLNVAGGGASG